MNNIEVKDFQDICRICLQHGDFKPDDKTNITQKSSIMLKCITGIEIKEDDKLPKNICSTCTKQLYDIDTFINLSRCNNAYLKNLLDTEEKREEAHDDCEKPLCDSFEDEDSFDEIENTVLSERKLNVKSKIIDTKKKSRRDLKIEFKGRKRKVTLSRTRKRIEECECKVCGKKFTRKGGLKRHSKIHLGIKPFECDICNKTFVEKATLNRHYLIHSGEKPFECNLCGKATTRKDQILEHITKHHPSAVNCDFVITEHKISERDRKEALADCKNSTQIKSGGNDLRTNKNNIEDHNIKHSIDFNEDENLGVGEVKQFKTKKRIEICLCNLCGKVFRRRGYLKNHMAIHAKIKPFECKICGKGFTQRHALTRHNLVHTKERPFQCNLCGKTFTRKEILMDHLKNHEEGSKPYLCFHCGKCFSNKDYLSKHLKYYLPGKGKKKVNSDERKCICPQCGKQLHSVSYLKTHLLTHTGEKPYECNICGNRFTVLRSLNHHLNIHKGVKPYQCTQCEKAFRTSSSLRKHILLHTGERPFKCTSCEKGFIRRSHLKRHLRIH